MPNSSALATCQTLSAVALLLWGTAGCSDSPSDVDPPLLTAEEVTFAPELGVDLAAMIRMPQGIYWTDIAEGAPDSVPAQPFFQMHVRFDGWIYDGTRFATNQVAEFLLSAGEVVSGWDLGLIGVRAGGERRLIVPPASAYGHRQTGVIPPNSVLVYDVRVDSILVPVQ